MIAIGVPCMAQFEEVQTIAARHQGIHGLDFRTMADLNGDGLKDLVLADCWMAATEVDGWAEPIYFDNSYEYLEFFAVDYDEDGDLDLLPRFTSRMDEVPVQGLLVFDNDGLGNLTLQQILPGFHGALYNAADYDLDGDIDLLVSDGTRPYWMIYENGFDVENLLVIIDFNFLLPYQLFLPALADLNGDGILDLLSVGVDYFDMNIWIDEYISVTIYVSLPGGQYEATYLYSHTVYDGHLDDMEIRERPLHVADFNADELLDVAVGLFDEWKVFYGKEGGGYTLGPSFNPDRDHACVMRLEDRDLLLCDDFLDDMGDAKLYDLSGVEENYTYLGEGPEEAYLHCADPLNLGTDQIVACSQELCSIELFLLEEQSNSSPELLYQASPCQYSEAAVLDQNQDERLDLILIDNERAYLETIFNEGFLPMDEPGNRIEFEGSLTFLQRNLERVLLKQTAQDDSGYVVELLTNEAGEYLGLDTIAFLPDASKLQLVIENIGSQGELHALLYDEQSKLLDIVLLGTSNVLLQSFDLSDDGGSLHFQTADQGSDGDKDIFYYSDSDEAYNSNIYLLENVDGVFAEPLVIGTNANLKKVVAFHFDQDGLVDFLIHEKEGPLKIIKQTECQSTESFQELSSSILNVNTVIFDADLDGDLDFACYEYAPPEGSGFVYLNNGELPMDSYLVASCDQPSGHFLSVDLVHDEKPELILFLPAPANQIRSYRNTIATTSNSGSLIDHIEIYPNPAKEQITISGHTKTATFMLYNSVGDLQLSDQMDPGQFRLETGGFSAGIYTLILSVRGKRIVRRFAVLK